MSPIWEPTPEEEDEERELEFELDYSTSLTVQERFALLFRRAREIREMLLRCGHRKPFEIVERP